MHLAGQPRQGPHKALPAPTQVQTLGPLRQTGQGEGHSSGAGDAKKKNFLWKGQAGFEEQEF